MKTAVMDLKKRAEIGAVRPTVEFLGLDRLKEMQAKADQAKNYSKECEDAMISNQKALLLAKRELEEKDRDLKEAQNSVFKHQETLKQCNNQEKVLLNENRDLKSVISSLQRTIEEIDLEERVPMADHIQILEERDRIFRDMEARLSLLTLQKIDLEKAYETLQKQHLPTYTQSHPEECVEPTPVCKEEACTHVPGLQATVKHVRPFGLGPNFTSESTTAKPGSKAAHVQGANLVIAQALEARTKDAQAAMLKKEAELMHKDLLEYRKLAIDSRDKARELEAQVDALKKENDELQQTVCGVIENEKVIVGSPLNQSRNLDAGKDTVNLSLFRAESNVRQLNDHIELLEQQNNLLNQDLADLRLQLDQEESKSSTLKDKLSRCQAKNEALKEELDVLKAQLLKATSSIKVEPQPKHSQSVHSQAKGRLASGGSLRPSNEGKAAGERAQREGAAEAELDQVDIQSRVLSLQSEVEELKTQNQLLKAELLNKQHAELRIEYLQRELDLIRVGNFYQTSLQDEEEELDPDQDSRN